LFGRSSETLTLIKTYADVLLNKNTLLSKSVIVVHGESGSGKTSLIESLRKPVSESNGFFCTGKFFQPSDEGGVSQEPYSAVMAAFSDLCDLVLQSTDYDSHRRNEIQQALGHHSNLLVNTISSLAPLLDENGCQEATQLGHFNTN
jgi:predicted ATPase